MFSFAGDVVLDPFLGSGTTSLAAMGCGRNSVGYEIDAGYLRNARKRIEAAKDFFTDAEVTIEV
jgi:DNA modification methylase